MTPELNHIYVGDCLDVMRSWPDAFVQTVVTSPPYWGLRDYNAAGQLGLEDTPGDYVAKMVKVFREVWRLMRDDGTLWLNLGDSYASAWPCSRRNLIGQGPATLDQRRKRIPRGSGRWGGGNNGAPGLKEKDLIGMPWRVAFALQADGWYLRSDIIWAKPNPMPESVTDRPTKAHEYLFLMTKSERYFYDADAVREKGSSDSDGWKSADGWDTSTGNGGHGSFHKSGREKGRQPRVRGHARAHDGFDARWDKMKRAEQTSCMRNKRSVWTVATCPFPEAHFATYPTELIKPCILAGSRHGDVVFDPFMGAGTTGLVAAELGRSYIGTELNPTYAAIAEKRLANERAQVKIAI